MLKKRRLRMRNKNSKRMNKRQVLVLFSLVLVLSLMPLYSQGAQEPVSDSGEVTVTLGYNAFLESSFTDEVPPIEAIRSELAKKYPNINLEYQVMPDDMLNALTIWMTSYDSTVDIYGMDTPWVSQFGRGGWAVPLNDRIPELEENFVRSGLETFSYNGDILGVPFWGSAAGLYYRTDLVEEYGFSPPETVDDMIEICRTILQDQPDMYGFMWPGQRGESLIMIYSTILYALGGQYTDAQGNYLFDSPKSIEAVKLLKSFVDERLSPRTVTNWTQSESKNAFAGGKGIFLWANQDIVIWLDNPEKSQVVGKWDFIPFPAQPEGQSVAVTGGFAFSANPNSKNLDAAIKVLEIIAGEAVQKNFALAWGPVQYYNGIYEDEKVQEYNPNVDKLPPVLEVTLNRPPSGSYAELSGIMQENLHGAITGTQSVEDAMRDIQRQATALMK
jgi:multiple sugar transport system substrate-binding protein